MDFHLAVAPFSCNSDVAKLNNPNDFLSPERSHVNFLALHIDSHLLRVFVVHDKSAVYCCTESLNEYGTAYPSTVTCGMQIFIYSDSLASINFDFLIGKSH